MPSRLGANSQVLSTWRMNPGGLECVEPIGIRDEDGNIAPYPDNAAATEEQQIGVCSGGAHFVGTQEKVPNHVGELVRATTVP